MKKPYALFLIGVLTGGLFLRAAAQQLVWSGNNDNPDSISKGRAVLRRSFPGSFKLCNLDAEPLRGQLFSTVNRDAGGSTVILRPNADRRPRECEIFEASS